MLQQLCIIIEPHGMRCETLLYTVTIYIAIKQRTTEEGIILETRICIDKTLIG